MIECEGHGGYVHADEIETCPECGGEFCEKCFQKHVKKCLNRDIKIDAED